MAAPAVGNTDPPNSTSRAENTKTGQSAQDGSQTTTDADSNQAGTQYASAKGAAPKIMADRTIELLEAQMRQLNSIIDILKSEISQRTKEREAEDSLPTTNLETFFQNIGAISTLGLGITFALIVSQLQDPEQIAQGYHFKLSTVRILIATSWLLFTVALVLGIYLGGAVKSSSSPESQKGQRTLAVILLYPLIGGAFICLSLAVAAYVDIVGFLILGLVLSIPVVVMPVVLFVKGKKKLHEVFAGYGKAS